MNPLVDLYAAGELTPDKAVIIREKEITFYELNNLITARSNFLKSEGIFLNDKCAILSPNNLDFILNVLALWRLSAIPVLLNTRLTPNEIKEQVIFTKCKTILCDKNLLKNVPPGMNVISEFNIPKGDAITNHPSADLNSTAIILFTSGSSGKPKGVELSFDNLISSAAGVHSFLHFTSVDRWLASLPFFHIGGFSIITRALLYGNPIIIPDSLSTDDLCKTMHIKKPTLTSLVSTQLLRLLENHCKPNAELRNVLLGGGFINPDLIIKAQTSGWKLSKVYGSSESSSMVTALDCSKSYKLNSTGKPFGDNEVIIVDGNNNKLLAGNVGEILVKSPSVAKGYFNNKEETKLKFKNGYYYTGDLGYTDDEGYIFIEARRTDLIISGGENVSIAEVEGAISKHPNIKESAVFPVEDKTWGQIPVAALVLKEGETLLLEELKIFLADKLSGYKIPRRILIVDELPKSALGKIERHKLKKLLNR